MLVCRMLVQGWLLVSIGGDVKDLFESAEIMVLLFYLI
jgi:hypothetical protein